MPAPLLATKLFVPPPRPNRVRRTRLRDRLATRGSGVTLVAAPAGSGKSTLLADWAVTAGMPVAWLSVESADDDPRRFLLYLGAALRSAQAVGPTDVFESMPSTQNALTAVMSELINAVAARGAAAALVLDDYHAIDSDAVHELVQFFIDHIPPNLHLVIATRVDPPLALSRLRARNQLLEIRAADLRFTIDESSSFFNGAEGLGLTPEQIAELDRRTEGWAVGLQMAAISMRGRTAAAQAFIENFSGSNRYVLDYLTEEVLAWQTPEVRSFLLQTSILSELCAPLCDAVTGRGDAERILQQLDGANLFLISLDHVRHWYRYHHLFATLLGDQLEKTVPAAEVAGLHRRAARWYSAEGQTELAIRHLVTAGDIDDAAGLVAQHGLNRIAAGDAAAVVSWLRLLPAEVLSSRLDLLLPAGLGQAVEFQLDRAQAAVTQAQQLITDETEAEQRGAVLAVQGLIYRMSGRTNEAIALYEEALPLLDPAETWYRVVTFDSSMASIMVADLLKAEEGFRKVRSEGERTKAFLPTILAQFMT
ncbi:MAG TPA: helix-turn-helix transcriptional regulator, partial [Thermoanaerobaculia bacterium]|nr:helix-turn-helix transcriptional regulator [Thermoanaerobaculia bacterium]